VTRAETLCGQSGARFLRDHAVAEILDRIKRALTGKDSRFLTENQRKVYSDLAGKLDVMMKYYQDAVANTSESEGESNAETKYNKRNRNAGERPYAREYGRTNYG